MLPHLLQVLKTLVLSLHDGAHAPESSTFQLLTPIEGVAKLHQSHVVFCHVVDEMFGSVYLTKSQLVVVLIVQDVHEVGVERVNLVKSRKFVQNGGKLVVKRLLRELDLSGVKLADSRYLKVLADHGRRFPLGARENDIHKVLRRRHHCDLLEVVVAHRSEKEIFLREDTKYFQMRRSTDTRARDGACALTPHQMHRLV